MSCFQQKLPLKSHFTSGKWNALTFPFLSGVKTRNETIDWEEKSFVALSELLVLGNSRLDDEAICH